MNRWVLIGIVLALVGGGVLFARKRQASNAAAAAAAVPKERVVPVTVATVAQKDVPIWLEGLGNARRRKLATVVNVEDSSSSLARSSA